MADHGGTPAAALGLLPFALVRVLCLDVETLRSDMPSPETLSDISALLS